jgi:hypothetical protein
MVMFNRTEFAVDLGRADGTVNYKRGGGLNDTYPSLEFGALAAWAWGYHRCVDLLSKLSYLDANRIAVSGHSSAVKRL